MERLSRQLALERARKRGPRFRKRKTHASMDSRVFPASFCCSNAWKNRERGAARESEIGREKDRMTFGERGEGRRKEKMWKKGVRRGLNDWRGEEEDDIERERERKREGVRVTEYSTKYGANDVDPLDGCLMKDA